MTQPNDPKPANADTPFLAFSMLAAGGLIFSVFLPWLKVDTVYYGSVTINGIGSVDGSQLLAAAIKAASTVVIRDGWFIIGGAVLVILLSISGTSTPKKEISDGVGGLGVLGLGVMIYELLDLNHRVELDPFSGNTYQVGIGPVVGLVACVIIMLSGYLSNPGRQKVSPITKPTKPIRNNPIPPAPSFGWPGPTEYYSYPAPTPLAPAIDLLPQKVLGGWAIFGYFILYFLSCLFMGFALAFQYPEILVLLVLISSIWAGYDAGKRRARFGPGVKDGGPGTFVACILIWIIFFPVYLTRRKMSVAYFGA